MAWLQRLWLRLLLIDTPGNTSFGGFDRPELRSGAALAWVIALAVVAVVVTVVVYVLEGRRVSWLRRAPLALLRFSAFNIRTTPEIEGVVTRISADTSTDQRTGQSYYTVRIAMAAEQIERLGEVKLLPGMPVEAFMQTRDRTMLSYLIKPLHDQFLRAFREK